LLFNTKGYKEKEEKEDGGGDQDESRVKRRDWEECRGKAPTNGRRTKRRKHRSKKCRRGNSKWKSEEGAREPQYFSY
jgi:hypothetical protein